jgi:hypothetical protein
MYIYSWDNIKKLNLYKKKMKAFVSVEEHLNYSHIIFRSMIFLIYHFCFKVEIGVVVVVIWYYRFIVDFFSEIGIKL